MLAHYLLGLPQMARLLPSLLPLLGLELDLQLPATPPPSSGIEHLWLLSVPFTLLAMTAVR